MGRAERLLQLMQTLRRHRVAVSGAVLAAELGVGLRTLYRDLAALRAQGADIQGEPGVGYVLRPGFVLPPLMFSHEEIEALVLGARWVAARGDPSLQAAARDAMAKIGAVLPAPQREPMETSPLLVGPGGPGPDTEGTVAAVRAAMRAECKVRLHYQDLQERQSHRTVWPFALGYFDEVNVLVAWCEQRQDVRHFRADRIRAVEVTTERYPRRRHALLRDWRRAQGIADGLEAPSTAARN
jgi:predicted DNA-binding transcriptional regulator YafY